MESNVFDKRQLHCLKLLLTVKGRKIVTNSVRLNNETRNKTENSTPLKQLVCAVLNFSDQNSTGMNEKNDKENLFIFKVKN